MRTTSAPECCKGLREALKLGTDGELYGPVIRKDTDGKYRAGSLKRPLKYCPWCGGKLGVIGKQE